jgi:predicted pPIWI-associating nuclease
MDDSTRKMMEILAKTDLERFSFGEKMSRIMAQAMKPSLTEMMTSIPHQALMQTAAQRAYNDAILSTTQIAQELSNPIAGFDSMSMAIEQLTLPKHLSAGWSELMARVEPLGHQAYFARELLQDRFSELSRISYIAGSIAETSDFGAANLAFMNEIETQNQLRDSLLYMSESATAFSRSIELSTDRAFSIHPTLLRFPSIEICNHATTISCIAPAQHSGGDEVAEFSEQLEEEMEADLASLLAETFPDLRQLWEGARQTVASTNPDATRHLTVSLRELVDHLLRTLAPDVEVKSWSNDATDFDNNGRPIRPARLRYIYRNINEDAFCDFVQTDIKAALDLIRIFQKGTHKVQGAFNEFQRRALLARTEGLVCYLLRIDRTNR